MAWQKQGNIYRPEGTADWRHSHAQLPVAEQIRGGRFRVYFATRNKNNMSQVGYVELDLTKNYKILSKTAEPIIELGALGTFDDSGVYPTAIVGFEGKRYLYYIGWMQGKRVPFYGALGLAISYDGGDTFQKYSEAPLLDRNDVDPYMTLSADVRREDGEWKMWYTSTTECVVDGDGNTIPNYLIKYAVSADGINWERDGTVCIDYESDNETRIARPCVRKDNGVYKMWYCYAMGSGGYNLGYAESEDGRNWRRRDDSVGISLSSAGWDSEMMAYPYVFDFGDRRYMLYNGNDYGRSGFGIASRPR